jgi:hypothetical protein
MTFQEYLAKARQDDAQGPASVTACSWRRGRPARHGSTGPVLPPGHGAWPG